MSSYRESKMIGESLDSQNESSPRCVLESQSSSTDSDGSYKSNIETFSLKSLTSISTSCIGFQWRDVFDKWKNRSERKMINFPHSSMNYEIGKRDPRSKLDQNGERDDRFVFGMGSINKPEWRNFDYEEIVLATDNFSSENLIGKGGYSEVYRGCLPDGQLVAIKRLSKKEGEDERVGDFLTELGIIAHINHPNAARLIGFGVDGGLHIVLQYSPHGSLSSLLHGSEEEVGIEWKLRYRVAIGVARGLLYLHKGGQRRIIHRDIKPSNILLTQDYQAQICDFGLAKWLPETWSHHVVSPIEGTFGYMAPEYFMHGILHEKTDVFAFGVLLLEIITGRHAVDACSHSLVYWAKQLLGKHREKDLVDPRLGDDYDAGEMKRMISVASMCIHHSPDRRPEMTEVLRLLKGDSDEDGSMEVFKKRKQRPNLRTLMLDTWDWEEEYICSDYLSDLNHHRQLALEF